MKKIDLFELQKIIKENKIILLFEGEFSQGILKNLVETLREKLLMDENELNSNQKYYVAKKVYSTFIELSQNIQQYSAEKYLINGHEVGTGIIIITENDEYFSITSGNKIEISKTKKVIDKCQYINNLDSQELKQFYKERIRGKRPEDSKRAGLGLIQMARQSKNELLYSYNSINDDYDFIIIEVKVNKEV